MSLRRKSCDACFKGRRKCDRDYPACSTCRRTKKSCHYAYPLLPAHAPDDSIPENEMGAGTRHRTNDAPADVVFLDLEGSDVGSRRGSFINRQRSPARTPPTSVLSIPSFMGGLGEVQRVEGCTDSWQWVINELKRCPRDLATRGETLFLHKELYRNVMPPAIRAAMGVSATSCMLNEKNRQLLFRVVDAEVVELLKPPPLLDTDGGDGGGSSRGMTLVEELARLQALTLYQMMRMFSGGLEQRAIVDLQQGLITTWALQLLRRSRAELGGDHHASDDWHTWIIAESIRRTVMVVYMFYGVYSIAMHGFCVEFPTLAKLPVWTSPASWLSEADHLIRRRNDEAELTLPYEAYTQSWMVSPPKSLHTFDKFLIVPCKGLEALSDYNPETARTVLE